MSARSKASRIDLGIVLSEDGLLSDDAETSKGALTRLAKHVLTSFDVSASVRDERFKALLFGNPHVSEERVLRKLYDAFVSGTMPLVEDATTIISLVDAYLVGVKAKDGLIAALFQKGIATATGVIDLLAAFIDKFDFDDDLLVGAAGGEVKRLEDKRAQLGCFRQKSWIMLGVAVCDGQTDFQTPVNANRVHISQNHPRLVVKAMQEVARRKDDDPLFDYALTFVQHMFMLPTVSTLGPPTIWLGQLFSATVEVVVHCPDPQQPGLHARSMEVLDYIFGAVSTISLGGTDAQRAECREVLEKDVYPNVQKLSNVLGSSAGFESEKFAATICLGHIFSYTTSLMAFDIKVMNDVKEQERLAATICSIPNGPVRLMHVPGALKNLCMVLRRGSAAYPIVRPPSADTPRPLPFPTLHSIALPISRVYHYISSLAEAGYRDEVVKAGFFATLSALVADEQLWYSPAAISFATSIFGATGPQIEDKHAEAAVRDGLGIALCDLAYRIACGRTSVGCDATPYLINILTTLVRYGDRVAARKGKKGIARQNAVITAILQAESVKKLRQQARAPAGKGRGTAPPQLTLPPELLAFFDDIERRANRVADEVAAELEGDDEGVKGKTRPHKKGGRHKGPNPQLNDTPAAAAAASSACADEGDEDDNGDPADEESKEPAPTPTSGDAKPAPSPALETPEHDSAFIAVGRRKRGKSKMQQRQERNMDRPSAPDPPPHTRTKRWSIVSRETPPGRDALIPSSSSSSGAFASVPTPFSSSASALPPPVPEAVSEVEALRMELEAIRREKEALEREKDQTLRRLQETTDCDICMAEKKSVVLVPCLHLSLCPSCVSRLAARPPAQRLCPRCRTPITSTKRIYV
ncbi:unnamed protein product [Vitrella brassicaformis CCMP3155]|uniref:RING-type domain-containing protein n=2 Tax=Vitrella brassicaformis TaxID=1169539 RepID=A0A0G4H3X8_VITBC|nr:unnamed protein product [Vitrella brassicaformis CCMP3155]|eukprot:CEM38413.1 unnamed protein product [Vitrella brassicaformis CCMP3155]